MISVSDFDRPITDGDLERIGQDWRPTDPLPWYQSFREMPMAIIEENEMPQWKDPEQLWNAAQAMGTDFVRYPAIGWAAHFYGQSEYLPKYPGMLPEEDFFGAVCKYFHARGGKVCAYNHFGGVMYGTTAQTHPQWLARDTEGNPIPWNDMHYLGCLSGEDFLNAMVNAMDEYCTRYGNDAIYLDAPSWYAGECHCQNCRALWQTYYGEDLPDSFPDGSPQLERLRQLHQRRIFALLHAVHAVTQKHGIPLIINCRGHNNPVLGHGLKELDMTLVEGTNAGEGYRPNASYWSMATLWRLGESFKRLAYAYCPTGPYDNLRSYGTDEALAVGMGQVMFGMTPFLESATSYLFDTTGGKGLRQVVENIHAHAPMYYRTAPVRDLGLVNDEYMIVRDPRRKRLEQEFQGCVEALTHGGRHFDCLYERHLSAARLAGYRCIYLPNTGYVTPQLEKALRQYAENGGSVICGPDFSRFDAQLQPLDNYTMADFLGADFIRENDRSLIDRHAREYRESASVFSYAPIPESYVKLIADLPGMPASSPVIPFSDPVVRIERPVNMYYTLSAPHGDTEVLAQLFLPAGGLRGAPLEFPEGAPPAITRHAYGKGWVYQLHFRPGYTYQHRGLPDLKQLLCALCDMPGNGPAVTVDSPGAVLCFLVEDKTQTRWLHLTNYTGIITERSMMIDRIAPLYDLSITIREDRPIRSVSTVYGGETLPFTRKDGYIHLHLPKLAIYETLRLE